MMALFNRGLLRDKTGDLRGAISDYSKVIDEFPNFWTGLHYRAGCYRRLGMNRQAEQDADEQTVLIPRRKADRGAVEQFRNPLFKALPGVLGAEVGAPQEIDVFCGGEPFAGDRDHGLHPF